MTIAGVLLAGGLARRMGGGDKSLRMVGGRPILAHVIARMKSQVAVLVLNANGDLARFAGWGLPVIGDTVAGYPGPLAGILAGMEWAGRTGPLVTDVVSVPSDTPFPPPDLVWRLSHARDEAGADIAVARSGGRNHPAIALWPVALADDLRAALIHQGLRKVADFAARYRTAVAEFPIEPVDPFHNVNEPSDIETAERLFRAGACTTK